MGEKSEAYRKRNKGFDVLSFDGGGTKGVMEAVIVKDIMNMATLLIRNPEKIKTLCIKILEENPNVDDQPEDLKKIAEQLEGVKSPVHPIEVFDMIVGTSTGKTLVTQPMLQLRPNWSELRPMDYYHQFFCRFQ